MLGNLSFCLIIPSVGDLVNKIRLDRLAFCVVKFEILKF